jgi:hypothetical protein
MSDFAVFSGNSLCLAHFFRVKRPTIKFDVDKESDVKQRIFHFLYAMGNEGNKGNQFTTFTLSLPI